MRILKVECQPEEVQGVAQWVGCLISMHEALVLIPRITLRLGIVVHDCTWEVEAGGSESQNHLCLQSNVEASQGFLRN